MKDEKKKAGEKRLLLKKKRRQEFLSLARLELGSKNLKNAKNRDSHY